MEIPFEDNVWTAATDGSLERVNQHLRGMGAMHVDVADENGFTPLMAAVQYGHVDLARELLNRGADPNKRDADGQTSLHHAETAACLRLLLDRGADPLIKSRDGTLPVDLRREELEEIEEEERGDAGIAEEVREQARVHGQDVAVDVRDEDEGVEAAPMEGAGAEEDEETAREKMKLRVLIAVLADATKRASEGGEATGKRARAPD